MSSSIHIPRNYYVAPPPPTGSTTNVVYKLQDAVLSSYGIDLHSLHNDITVPSHYQAPGLPFFATNFHPKDQLLLYMLHKLLTFVHDVPPTPPYDTNTPVYKETITLSPTIMHQSVSQSINIPVLSVPDETMNNPEYLRLMRLFTELIDLHRNAYGVLPAPTDDLVFAAMRQAFETHMVPIEITINTTQPTSTQHVQPAQHHDLNNFVGLLSALSRDSSSYMEMPLLTTMQSVQQSSINNPNNALLFHLSTSQVHTQKYAQNQQEAAILTSYNPQPFILPLHIPLLMSLGQLILPGLNNVIQQLLPRNPQLEVAKAYRFHVAMNCFYTHLICLCTLLLTFNMPMQLDLLKLHDPSMTTEAKSVLYNTCPFIWVSGTYDIPPHIISTTPTPNPTILAPPPPIPARRNSPPPQSDLIQAQPVVDTVPTQTTTVTTTTYTPFNSESSSAASSGYQPNKKEAKKSHKHSKSYSSDCDAGDVCLGICACLCLIFVEALAGL